MADYIPSSLGGLYTWCTNFSTKIGTLGAGLGRSPAQITAMQALCTAIKGRIDARVTAANAAKAATATMNSGNRADLGTLRGNIGELKEDPGFDETKGAELDVNAPLSGFDPNAYVGEITGLDVTMPQQVTLQFSKAGGEIDGVNVYMRLQGTSAWKFLARDTMSPYVDTTPLAVAGAAPRLAFRRGMIAVGCSAG